MRILIFGSDPVAALAVDERTLSVAVSLMRMALALLDRSGDQSFGAARLQHAIDTVVDGGSGRSVSRPR